MIVNLNYNEDLYIKGANCSMHIWTAGERMTAQVSTNNPVGIIILETMGGTEPLLRLFSGEEAYQRWMTFEKRKSNVYRVNPDGTLEHVRVGE